MNKTVEEVKKAMQGCNMEELVRWLKHVENNPYRGDKGNVSGKIAEVLRLEVERRQNEQ